MLAPPLALLVVLAAPPAPPVELAAERIEITADGVDATALRLELPAARLDAATARGARTAACIDGRLRLTDVRLGGPTVRAAADEARLCLGGPAVEVEAERLWVSPCGCDDPPWRVSARAARMTPGDGAWLTWPVLRAGEVPILAAPVAYVPLARRQTGFLLPRLGWDGEDGLYGSLPFFWAPLGALDLTLAPGWRADPGVTVDGRLRWAATPDEGGEIEAFTAPLAGEAVARGGGTLPVGPLRLATDGRWADAGDSWRRHTRGFIERNRRILRADLGVASTADDLGLGIRLRRLQFIPPDAPESAATTPLAWLHVGAGLGPARLTLDGAASQAWRAGPDGEVFDVALRASANEWLGPIALRPVLAARTRVHPATDSEAAAQSLAGMAGLEATVALQRRYAAGLHRLALTLDGRWAAASPGDRVLDHADRPRDARDLGATLSTGFAGEAWHARMALRAGWDAIAAGPAPIWLRGRIDGRWVGMTLDAAADGGFDAKALWLDGRLGPADGPRVTVSGVWARMGAELPWLAPVGLVLPTRQVPWAHAIDESADPGRWLAEAPIAGVTAGATLPLGPLTLGYTAGLDLSPESSTALVGQIGTLDWRGRCDCWSVGLWLGHEAGRATPDVMLEVTLGRL